MSVFPGIVVLLVALLVVWTRVLWRKAEAEIPPAGSFCPVEGGEIHFVEAGPKEAQTLVLIHGLSGQLQHFDYGMADELSRDFRVIALDRPGCGYSTRDHDDLAALPDQARMIWACLDQLNVENPVLVGHSLGGAVSLTMALERPDGAKALALICPATQSQDDAPDVFKGLRVRTPLMRRVIGHVLAVPTAYLTTRKVLDLVFAPERWPDDFLTRGGALLGYRPEAFVSASADLVAMENAMPQQVARYANELKTPGAILFGADDAVLSPDLHGQGMAEFGLPCDLLPGSGHMIPITAPAECCEFVRRVANSPS